MDCSAGTRYARSLGCQGTYDVVVGIQSSFFILEGTVGGTEMHNQFFYQVSFIALRASAMSHRQMANSTELSAE